MERRDELVQEVWEMIAGTRQWCELSNVHAAALVGILDQAIRERDEAAERTELAIKASTQINEAVDSLKRKFEILSGKVDASIEAVKPKYY